MKRIMLLMVLAVGLLIPSVSFAAGQVGVYVAPKFVYGLTQMDGTKSYSGPVGGPMFSGSLGSKSDSTFGGSIAIGYDFNKQFSIPVRTELEYAAFSRAEIKKTDPTNIEKAQYGIQTLFFNAYYDIHTGTKFTPYVGAGLGMGFINSKASVDWVGYSISTGSHTETNFAWNVGAGLGYDVTDNLTIDAGYRLVGLGEVKTKTYTDSISQHYVKTNNLYQHQFALGVRFKF